MAVVTRFIIERKGQLIKDPEGNLLMYVDKAEADAIDRKLDATETLAEIMSNKDSTEIDYDLAYRLAEALVEQAETVQEAIRPVIADNKKRSKKE
jgi:dsDNA-binding SOS-regulon protein